MKNLNQMRMMNTEQGILNLELVEFYIQYSIFDIQYSNQIRMMNTEQGIYNPELLEFNILRSVFDIQYSNQIINYRGQVIFALALALCRLSHPR